jgi:hypothetical protein
MLLNMGIMEKKRNESKGGTDMLGDKNRRIFELEKTVAETNYKMNAMENAIKVLFSMIEDLQKKPIVEEKSDPSAKLRNKDGLLDSRLYFSRKLKEDEE